MEQLPTAVDFMRVVSELDESGQRDYIYGLGIENKSREQLYRLYEEALLLK